MPDDFDSALAFVLAREGGYVNDPADPGGQTKFGISKRSYPSLDIAALTREQAAAIYRRDFWDKLGLGDLPGPVALVVFDAAVNHGPAPAASFLQAAYNALAVGDQLAVDGHLGPVTRLAVAVWVGGDPARGQILAREVLLERAAFYALLYRASGYARFIRGWLNRIRALREAISRQAHWAIV